MRLPLLRASLLVSLLVALLTVLGSPATAAADDACVKPPKRDDDTIHVQGCLRDLRGDGDKAVPGVTITVLDDEGNVLVEGETDQTGLFDLALPGTVIDVLGTSIVVEIDTDTLPEGTALQNPKQESLTADINTESDQFFTFPIDDAPEVDAQVGPGHRPARAAASSSRCCSRWPRSGCP